LKNNYATVNADEQKYFLVNWHLQAGELTSMPSESFFRSSTIQLPDTFATLLCYKKY